MRGFALQGGLLEDRQPLQRRLILHVAGCGEDAAIILGRRGDLEEVPQPLLPKAAEALGGIPLLPLPCSSGDQQGQQWGPRHVARCPATSGRIKADLKKPWRPRIDAEQSARGVDERRCAIPLIVLPPWVTILPGVYRPSASGTAGYVLPWATLAVFM
jgi:hypothetical protein